MSCFPISLKLPQLFKSIGFVEHPEANINQKIQILFDLSQLELEALKDSVIPHLAVSISGAKVSVPAGLFHAHPVNLLLQGNAVDLQDLFLFLNRHPSQLAIGQGLDMFYYELIVSLNVIDLVLGNSKKKR